MMMMTLREQLETAARQVASDNKTRAALMCFLNPTDAFGGPIVDKPIRLARQHEVEDDPILQRHLDMFDLASEYVVVFLVHVISLDGVVIRRLPSIVVKYQDQHT